MKQIAALLLFLGIMSSASGEVYQEVRVAFGGPAGQARLLRTGLSFEEGVFWRADSAEMIVSEAERRKLESAGFRITVLKPDAESYYRLRLQAEPRNPFATGKMGGFFTFSETLQKLRSFRQKYRGLVSRLIQIGTSMEGRPIFAVKISDHADVNENEPEALYTALHHSREPESLMCLLYFMEKLLQDYGKDAEATYLVNNRQLWFVPVVNPDGYVYNELTSPAGGGLWRKNRRPNADGSYGVDLNRNYGYMWGFDDLGSSPAADDEAYRGPGPFSEPETAAIRDFVMRRKLITALNYHSYRNGLIYSWNYADLLTPQDMIFRDIGAYLTRYNGYTEGNSSSVLHYTANGEAGDWLYGDGNGKRRIFALTPEVGKRSDGFWPAGNRILQLAQENYWPNLQLAGMAGGYPAVRAVEYATYPGGGVARFRPGGHYQIKLTLRNIGFSRQLQNVSVRLTSPTKRGIVEADAADFGAINPIRNKSKSGLRFQISPQATANQQIPFDVLMYLNGTFLRKETIWIRIQNS